MSSRCLRWVFLRGLLREVGTCLQLELYLSLQERGRGGGEKEEEFRILRILWIAIVEWMTEVGCELALAGAQWPLRSLIGERERIPSRHLNRLKRWLCSKLARISKIYI